jgi:creatinine amidohydrolase/Fe(II)-dependent formamide hydrolase-like protein
MYPIRLWTVAVFVFGMLPIALKRKIGRILVGDEYDCTQKQNYQGITHYNSLYDQSKYFDNALTRLYLKKGWNIYQYSIIRSLSELLIEKILVERYPDLQRHQISCHAAHEKDGRIYPCGKCEKCRRIVGMLTALDKDPTQCGYTPAQVVESLRTLEHKKVKQIGPDAAQLFHMLIEQKAIEKNDHTLRLARHHKEILHLRFDQERSNPADLPLDMRVPVYKIYMEHAPGALAFINRIWQSTDPYKDDFFKVPYPFEFNRRITSSPPRPGIKPRFLWELLSWEEIEERLQYVDTALLPCGSIEQHGPHLPVDVDYYDIVYLARKVAEACSDPKPFVLPGIPYGVSYHHEDFKGTLSVTNDALAKFVYDIGMNLAKSGIKKLILLNGHGDNAPTLKYAAQMINRDAKIFVCIDTGETSDTDLNDLAETPNDVHAGEIETSTTLALRPELVNMEKARNSTLKFGSSYLDFTSARGVPWYVHTSKLSESGIMGDPTRATAEKGKRMWEIMIAHLVKFVEEVKSSKIEDLYQKRY